MTALLASPTGSVLVVRRSLGGSGGNGVDLLFFGPALALLSFRDFFKFGGIGGVGETYV